METKLTALDKNQRKMMQQNKPQEVLAQSIQQKPVEPPISENQTQIQKLNRELELLNMYMFEKQLKKLQSLQEILKRESDK